MKLLRIKKLLILSLILLITSCQNRWTTDGLTEEVRNDIGETLTSKSKSEGRNYEIKDLTLINKGEGEYDGILETIEDGEEFSYEIVVNVDGANFIWKIVN
jgi:hypothetical protein